jgi:hypothetical protein
MRFLMLPLSGPTEPTPTDYNLRAKMRGVADKLNNKVYWAMTPQGHAFWSRIYDLLCQGENGEHAVELTEESNESSNLDHHTLPQDH